MIYKPESNRNNYDKIFDDPRLSILNVASLLDITILRRSGNEYIARCPFCGDSSNPRHGHLYLNIATNQYHCVLCNRGGFALGMYAEYRGITKKQALYEIIGEKIPPIAPPKPRIQEETPIASLEQRNKVYTAFLDMLILNSKHVANLRSRGFTLDEIAEKGYRSVPDDKEKRLKICRKLIEEGYELKGIPGFYTESGNWIFSCPPGFFIPVKDVDGKIQGLQIRLDKADDEGKYRWFSSRDKENGTRAKSWIHFVPGESDDVVITEGPLKADVAAFLSGATFIGLPGVNACDGLLEMLNKLGKRKTFIAYDMDKKQNKQVEDALKNLAAVLKKEGYRTITVNWDIKDGKGVDDYLLTLKKTGRNTNIFNKSFISKLLSNFFKQRERR